MDEKELREMVGLEPDSLIDTPCGLLDIMSVKDDKVVVGYLATGNAFPMCVDEFISHFSTTTFSKAGDNCKVLHKW